LTRERVERVSLRGAARGGDAGDERARLKRAGAAVGERRRDGHARHLLLPVGGRVLAGRLNLRVGAQHASLWALAAPLREGQFVVVEHREAAPFERAEDALA
jgi:hypothetical protein